MNEIIELNPKELGLVEKTKADQIKATFEPMSKMLAEFDERYLKLMEVPIEETTVEAIKDYKRLRLDIGRVRIDTGKAKDKAKEYLKLEDKAIMGVHNILVWAVKEKEDKLKERENYFENIEKERLVKLQADRVALLSEFIEDAELRDLTNLEDDEFEALLLLKKTQKLEAEQAVKLAEEERLATIKKEAEEKEALRVEHERLKAELEEKEKQRLAEVAETKRLQDIKDAEAKAIRDEESRVQAEKDAKIEAEKVEAKRIQDAKDLKAKEEREKIEAELQAKKDAEAKRLAEEEAKKIADAKALKEAEQAELNKGDKAKFNDLINDLESLKTKYSFKSEANIKKYSDVVSLLDKVITHITK